jgi:hypothetical protein
MARRIARAVRSYTGRACTSDDVLRAIGESTGVGGAYGTHNAVTRICGGVALRVSLAPITAAAAQLAEAEIAHACRAHDAGLGLRVLWYGVVAGRYVSCWPWASCALKRARSLALSGTRRMPFGAEVYTTLRRAARLFVLLDVKLANIVFAATRRTDVRLIDFDPNFVRDARDAPDAAARFVAVQILLIDLSAMCVGARVCSLSDIRRAAACHGATTEELGVELARAARAVMRSYDEAFAVMLARVLALYVAVPLEIPVPDEARVRWEPVYTEALLRAGLCACYDRAGLSGALDALRGPLVGRGEDGDVHVAPALTAKQMAPVVDVDRPRDDERHEVLEPGEPTPRSQIRRRDAVHDDRAGGLEYAPPIEVERGVRIGAEREYEGRNRRVSHSRARTYVA